MTYSRQWYLACATVLVVGAASGFVLRFAFSAAKSHITMASELKPSDPRYKEVMCGPDSLSTALGRLGISRLPAEIALKCRVTSRGVALAELDRYANGIETVSARSQALTWDELTELNGVAVLFVDGSHFLAVDPREIPPDLVTIPKVRIYEQDVPTCWLAGPELAKRWDGKALVLTKQQFTDTTEPAPRIEWDSCLVDRGIVKDERAEYQFTLRNAGRRELTIDKVTASCGCTGHVLSQKSLKPGESALLTANVDLNGRDGYVHPHLLVETNDAANAASIVRMIAWVPRLRAVSTVAIQLEDLPQGSGVIRAFYVADPGFAGRKIRDIHFLARDTALRAHISCEADVDPIQEDAPNLDIPVGFRTRRDYRVRLSIKTAATCPAGPFEGDVSVSVETDDGVKTHNIAIYGSIVKDIYPVPRVALITLGQDPESTGRASIQLNSHANRDINVVRTWSDMPGTLKIQRDALANCYIITAQTRDVQAGTPPVKGAVSLELGNGDVVSIPVAVFRPPG